MATHSSIPAWRVPGTGGAWWAAVYGVAQSRTRLKRLSSSSSIPAPIQRAPDGETSKEKLVSSLPWRSHRGKRTNMKLKKVRKSQCSPFSKNNCLVRWRCLWWNLPSRPIQELPSLKCVPLQRQLHLPTPTIMVQPISSNFAHLVTVSFLT